MFVVVKIKDLVALEVEVEVDDMVEEAKDMVTVSIKCHKDIVVEISPLSPSYILLMNDAP